jgi:hypothetical protein
MALAKSYESDADKLEASELDLALPELKAIDTVGVFGTIDPAEVLEVLSPREFSAKVTYTVMVPQPIPQSVLSGRSVSGPIYVPPPLPEQRTAVAIIRGVPTAGMVGGKVYDPKGQAFVVAEKRLNGFGRQIPVLDPIDVTKWVEADK